MKAFFDQLITFLTEVSRDSRIPDRDKKVILALVAYILSPVDLIPDWIPVLGWIDDWLVLALILDYLFNVLDSKILLSHFPWSMTSFARIRRVARLTAVLTPGVIKEKIWAYEGDPLDR